MLEAFLTFINQQKLDLHKKSTLLTVSGGVDSIVLAHLFFQAGFRAGIAHCNFGLRGEESDGDEAFVKALAAEYKFPFFVRDFSTRDHAEKEGISTQMAARDLRYRWFEEIRAENGFDWIATAHHANDSFETVILNVVRGTGLAGFHGIAAQNKTLIRPLIFASRAEIQDYLRQHQLSWREDSSNESIRYKRNLIRHEIVPVLKRINPSLENTFRTTTKRVGAAENLLNDFLNQWKKEHLRNVGDEYYISIPALTSVSEPTYRLWFILQDFGFSYIQTEEIYTSAEGISGKIFKSRTHQVLKDRDYFIISHAGSERYTSCEISKPSGAYIIDNSVFLFKIVYKNPDFLFEVDNSIAYLNISNLKFPLLIRTWETGDSFCPFGMKGKRKKVSDLLIDLKLNRNQKKQVKVLVNGNGDIIWVIGYRTDERYRVGDNCEEIVLITQKLMGVFS